MPFEEAAKRSSETAATACAMGLHSHWRRPEERERDVKHSLSALTSHPSSTSLLLLSKHILHTHWAVFGHGVCMKEMFLFFFFVLVELFFFLFVYFKGTNLRQYNAGDLNEMSRWL